ncbi:MAG: ABC transporter ATP-binding protein [Methylobacteriaceae bacterium]|nr:ABC transporter ATP-binding protein [Methylobacteriaceae bacterium]
MSLPQGTIIAPTDAGGLGAHAGRSEAPMKHASFLWPSPLRRRLKDVVFTGRQMPRRLIDFVWRMSAWDQMWLTLISVGVALLGTAPIEVQRRMVNEAIRQKDLSAIKTLALIYAGLVVAQGLLKLVMNMYRSWLGANTIRLLRTSISALAHERGETAEAATSQGVKISMIIAESDAIGGFVGDCVSEPVLEGSILLAVFTYMLILQPLMALASMLILATQMVFVPIIQQAINRRVQARIRKLREAGADVIASEEAANAEELGHEGRFREVFRLDMGIFTLKFTLNFLMNITTHMGTVAILSLGAWFVVEGRTEVGTVVAFLSGLANITDPWGDIVNWFQNLMVTSAKYKLVRDAAAEFSEMPKANAPDVSVEPGTAPARSERARAEATTGA